jgi:predicted ribosomally synthesized peptide with SipW-like signal peptide
MKKFLKPALLLAAIAIMVIGMLGSGAWFTDTKSTTESTITSGTLKIGDFGSSSFDLGAIAANMAPGEKTEYVTLTIENTGTKDLAWMGDLVVGDSPLKNDIYIDYAEMQFLSPNGNNWYTDQPHPGPDNFILNGKGSGPWPTAWTGPEGLATLNVFDGNGGMTPETNKYEFFGALRPGYKYQLKLRFGYYEGATAQNLAPLTLSFRVDATQISQPALSAFGVTVDHQSWLLHQIDLQNAQFANGN